MKIITNIPKIMEIDYINILIIQSICIMSSILSTEDSYFIYSSLKKYFSMLRIENYV